MNSNQPEHAPAPRTTVASVQPTSNRRANLITFRFGIKNNTSQILSNSSLGTISKGTNSDLKTNSNQPEHVPAPQTTVASVQPTRNCQTNLTTFNFGNKNDTFQIGNNSSLSTISKVTNSDLQIDSNQPEDGENWRRNEKNIIAQILNKSPLDSIVHVPAPPASAFCVPSETSAAHDTNPQTSTARVPVLQASAAPAECIEFPDSENDAQVQADDRECQQLLQEPTIKQRLQPLYSQLFALVERNSALVQKLRQHQCSTSTEMQQHTVHVSMDPHVILAETTLSKLQQCFNAHIITSTNGGCSLAFFHRD